MAAPIKAVGPKSDKIWRDAIMIAIKREAEDGGRHIDRLARSLIAKASEGDVAALREIGDRLDGKPTQEATITHEGELTVLSAPVSAVNSFFADALGYRESVPDPDTLPN